MGLFSCCGFLLNSKRDDPDAFAPPPRYTATSRASSLIAKDEPDDVELDDVAQRAGISPAVGPLRGIEDTTAQQRTTQRGVRIVTPSSLPSVNLPTSSAARKASTTPPCLSPVPSSPSSLTPLSALTSPSYITNDDTLSQIPNPYPEVITLNHLRQARQEWVSRGHKRHRYAPQPTDVLPSSELYDLDAADSADEDKHLSPPALAAKHHRRALLYAIFGLTGKREQSVSPIFEAYLSNERAEFFEGEAWSSFRETVFPCLGKVAPTVERAVCLGLGTLFSAATREGMLKIAAELAAFLNLVHFVRLQRRLAEMEGELEMIFQEPWFKDSDARLISALGGKAVQVPYAGDYIDGNTLVFSLNPMHDVSWNFTLKDCGRFPVVLVANELREARAAVMADALVERHERRKEGFVSSEVEDVYERSERFFASHREVGVPEVKCMDGTRLFDGAKVWIAKDKQDD